MSIPPLPSLLLLVLFLLPDYSFSAELPTGLSSRTSLRVSKASNNLFNGGIPQDITLLPKLPTSVLDGNKLSSQVSATVVSCNSSNALNLSRNEVTSQVPAGLGLLKFPTLLDLSRHNLSCQIRGELGSRKLVSRDLSANNLTRTTPSQLDNSAFKRSLRDNPGLCSDIPLSGLISCSSRSQAGPSSKISSNSVSIAAILICLMLNWFKGKETVDSNCSTCNDAVNSNCLTCKEKMESKWTLTPVHQDLPFTKSRILEYLNDKNLIRQGDYKKKVYKIPINNSGEFVVVWKIPNETNLKKEPLSIPEVEILRKTQHSNIVKLFGYLKNDTFTLPVYAYLENKRLDHWLYKEVRDWPKRLRIAVGVAEGLCYMHHQCRQVVIHKDIRSSNILLDGDFNAKIAKFKSARFLIDHTETSKAGGSGRTPRDSGREYAYKGEENNAKTDVYDFGVVLLELVTGKEAPNKDNKSMLVEWDRQHFDALNRQYSDALGTGINKPMQLHLSQMIQVFKIARWCMETHTPTMKDVCGSLKKVCECNPALGARRGGPSRFEARGKNKK